MRFVAMVAVLAGCGVNIDGRVGHAIDARAPRSDAGQETVSDAASDGAVAALDAPVCSGGDARAVAPDGSCLMLLTAAQTWVEAQASCVALGAHPALLPSQAMDVAAETLVANFDTFIGLTDEVAEGTFVWFDGSPLVFSNWHSDEPNNGGGRYSEDCAVIAGSRPGKQWDDRPCAPVSGVGAGQYAVLCQQ